MFFPFGAISSRQWCNGQTAIGILKWAHVTFFGASGLDLPVFKSLSTLAFAPWSSCGTIALSVSDYLCTLSFLAGNDFVKP